MRKNTKLIAIVAILLIATGVITFEACNKKNEVVKNTMPSTPDKSIIYQEQVPDREAYIVEFKKTLLSASKTDDVLTVENANAFLFDLLNYDFCNINGDGPNKSHEISDYTISVSNGVINLNEFAALYSQISSHVYDYYHSLNLENTNYYCIFPKIVNFDANATTTTVSVLTVLTSGHADKSINYNYDLCDYFPADTLYQWQDAAVVLENCFNDALPVCSSDTGRCYYVNDRERKFYYADYYYPGTFKSRLYVCGTCDFDETYIDQDEMCALLNSYIDLAYEYARESCVINGTVEAIIGNLPNNNPDNPVPIHHYLTVDYVDVMCTTGEPNL